MEELRIDRLKKIEGQILTLLGLDNIAKERGVSFDWDILLKELREQGVTQLAHYKTRVEFYELSGEIVEESEEWYKTKIKITNITEVCMDLKEVLSKENVDREFECTDNGMRVRNKNRELEYFFENKDCSKWTPIIKSDVWDTASYKRI